MNLDEFRQKMESDATKENDRLKRDLEDLEEKYDDMRKVYFERVSALNNDCQALANRCWVLTQGSMCCFCELREFRCPHAWSNDQIIEAAKKMRKEKNNAEN